MGLEKKRLIRILKRIGEIIPPLASIIVSITNPLNEDSPTSQQLIEKNLNSIEETEKSTKPEEQASESSEIPTKMDNTEKASIETSLNQIKQDFSDERDRRADKLERIKHQESRIFFFFIVFIVLALGLITWGAYITLISGFSVFVAVSEFVGLLAGSASFLLRFLHKSLKDEERELEKQHSDQTKYLRAIQTALSLSGNEREQQLVETAKWLRESSSA